MASEIGSKKNYFLKVKAHIRDILRVNPRGLSVSRLLSLYQKQTKEKIVLRELGFPSMNIFLRSITDIIRIENRRTETMLYPIKIVEKEIKPSIAPPGASTSSTSSISSVPKKELNMSSSYSPKDSDFLLKPRTPSPIISPLRDIEEKSDDSFGPFDLVTEDPPLVVMGFGDAIPPAISHQEIFELAAFVVVITEVHSPYRFWFHFESEFGPLNAMMEEMAEEYSNLIDDELCIPSGRMKLDMAVAADYDNEWHRGVLVQKPVEGFATIFFPDFGTTSRVHVDKIRYLLRQFGTLPRCAHRGSLADIIPTNGFWSLDATLDFLEVVKGNVKLYASCQRLRKFDAVHYLQLIDTYGIEDVNLGRWLVDEGHAMLREDHWPIKRLPHLLEIFPHFGDLERGEFVNLNGVIKRIRLGWTVNEIYRPPYEMIDYARMQRLLDEARERIKLRETVPVVEENCEKDKLYKIIRFLRNKRRNPQVVRMETEKLPRKRYSRVTFIMARILKRLEQEETNPFRTTEES